MTQEELKTRLARGGIKLVNLNHDALYISSLPSGRSQFLLKAHKNYYRADVDKNASRASVAIWPYCSLHPDRSRYETRGLSLMFCADDAVIYRETLADRMAIETAQNIKRKYPKFF